MMKFPNSVKQFQSQKEFAKELLIIFFRAEIISFENGKIESCNYEDTKSYQVTEMFINNREILTEYLLNESEREE